MHVQRKKWSKALFLSLQLSCIGDINGCLHNAIAAWCACAKLEMELYATATSPCYSTPTFCKKWLRWSDTGLIMRAVIAVCHLETGTETEITWTNRLWLHQGVISSYQWVSSGSHDRSQKWLGHSCRLDELCMQCMSTASEPVKEIFPTYITVAQSRGSSQHWGA